jgi:hypothetical protein
MLRRTRFAGQAFRASDGDQTVLPTAALLPLVLFVALLLALSLQVLAASGHFPREHRAPALASKLGSAILYGSLALVALCLLAGLVGAWRLIPWYAAVIGGGGAVLVAPLVLQGLPDSVVDGRQVLVVLAATSVGLAALLLWQAR